MMCYKDMTFCGYDSCKNFIACPRALTEKVGDEARSLKLLIAQFADKPECYEANDE